ncbi:MAG: hypothetical protein IPK63_15035 [Candidatus Competibacteraceae bacterium]|nr:hypothetical protein [Candidatus Competibacteraceae bacterium]
MNEGIGQIVGYLRGIWRNRWYAMGCAWVICIIGWFVVFRLPDQFQGSARVFVDTQSVLRPLLKGLTIDVDPNAQVALVAQTLLSRPNLEKIIEFSELNPPAKTTSLAFDQLAYRLQQRIKLAGSGKRDDNLYSITFQDPNPDKAKKVVESVIKVFENNLNSAVLNTDAAQVFLDKQVEEYEARLVAAENRLKEFKLKNVGLMPTEGQNYNARMQQVTNDLGLARLELAQAENRRNSIQQQINNSLQQLKGDGSGAVGEPVVLPIDGRIQSLEQKLDDLLIQFTDKHPDVSILKKSITELKAQREQERAQYATNLSKLNANSNARGPKTYSFYDELKVKLAEEEATIASLSVRATEFKKRYDELHNQVNTLPKVEAELTALNRDYELNRSKYDDLVARRESARLSQQAEESRQDVRFQVIEPPRVPLKPSWPNRLLLMTLVLVGGLAAGIGLAFLMMQLWPTFDDRRGLRQQITDVPVFGSVSLVLSPHALRRERRMAATFASVAGLLLLVYASLLAVEKVGLL